MAKGAVTMTIAAMNLLAGDWLMSRD
jgi:hypothetical protein